MPHHVFYPARLKRFVDGVVASGLLIVLLPLIGLLALLIRIDSPGPVFHRDERVGWRGRRFTMYKFRSMIDGAARMRPSLLATHARQEHPFNLAADPRITRLGRWLRRTALDELPQLFNVLKGEMSLVGPRPLLVADLENCPARCDGWKEKRERLRPGMTGPWQVRTRRDPKAPFEVMMSDDCAYVDDASFGRDCAIVLATLLVLLRGIARPVDSP